MRNVFGTLLAVLALAVGAGSREAIAHPHVWVTVKSEMVYAPDGSVTAIRHHWTFDEMFSTFATQGMDTNNDGKLSREELQDLAEVNVTSLKEFGYFTTALGDGKKSELLDAKEHWLEHQGGQLTLHFTLPLKAPAKAKNLEVSIYDGTYFVDFALAKLDAAKLVDAPAACKVTASAPEAPATPDKPLTESFFNSLSPSSTFGAQFANKITVTCP